ncbi:chemotaxis protein CheC [Clostridium amylolyticum]|uniref:Chemotaxis protein CheC n=1 Tax=Clostridium amylolyticum TaxID=1121298 RepID=A0A1M6CCP1_9CLOT|nr:chemotaxis protein CheC [Clostridium amylolyticum]SHI58488.1 chemotaxis protein CheC [Clostridium amylolyticum]
MDYRDLTSLQLDALREVGNIGAGNAATALSQLLNKKIDMTVPHVNIIDFQQMIDGSAEAEVVGIMVRVLGDTPGNILFVFEKSVASNIIELLTGIKEEQFSDMGTSVLSEVANIVSSSYMNAISRLTNLTLVPSVPAMAYDMLVAILSTMFIESSQFDDSILDIETNFVGTETKNIGAHFYYVPRPGSLEKILNSLGVI